jgi:hypothetical protein
MKLTSALLLASCILAVPVFADTTWVVCGTPAAINQVPFCGHSTDAMRFQVLYLQNELNLSGEIVAFGLAASDNQPAEFDNVRISLCHTGRTNLDSVFANNYDGNTPKLVFQADSLRFGAADTWFCFPCSFAYNNTANLLFELQWRGDAGSNVDCFRSDTGPLQRRAWKVGNDTAAVGQTDNVQAYYARLGFLPGGMAEGGVLPAGPALDVRPGIGRNFVIRYQAPAGARALVEVSDVSGRKVACLSPAAGADEARWYANLAPAGVYLVRVTDAGRTRQKHVVVPE